MEISSSFNNIQNNKVTSDKNKEAKKNPNPAPLNKDTVSFSGKAKEAAGKTVFRFRAPFTGARFLSLYRKGASAPAIFLLRKGAPAPVLFLF